MGFHCGNTSSQKLTSCEMKYQLIMHRGLEPDKEPDITCGTLEGETLSLAISPSSVCNPMPTQSSPPMWQRARSCRYPPVPSAVSVSSPS